jgi:hypothetical protein
MECVRSLISIRAKSVGNRFTKSLKQENFQILTLIGVLFISLWNNIYSMPVKYYNVLYVILAAGSAVEMKTDKLHRFLKYISNIK